jgi:hypothetical protein
MGLTAKWEDRGRAKWEAIGEARGEAIGEARGEAIGEARGEAIGEARGEAIGEKTAWEKVVSLMKQGYTVDELERMVPAGVPPFRGGIENGQERRNNA